MKEGQTTINLPCDVKKKVRILAAEMGVSMGRAAGRFIELGLEDYLKQNHLGLTGILPKAPVCGGKRKRGRVATGA